MEHTQPHTVIKNALWMSHTTMLSTLVGACKSVTALALVSPVHPICYGPEFARARSCDMFSGLYPHHCFI